MLFYLSRDPFRTMTGSSLYLLYFIPPQRLRVNEFSDRCGILSAISTTFTRLNVNTKKKHNDMLLYSKETNDLYEKKHLIKMNAILIDNLHCGVRSLERCVSQPGPHLRKRDNPFPPEKMHSIRRNYHNYFSIQDTYLFHGLIHTENKVGELNYYSPKRTFIGINKNVPS